MTHDEMLALCKRWAEAQNGHNLEAMAALYAPNAQIESPMAGSLTGPEGVVKGTEAFFAAFPDAGLTMDTPIADGDRVVFVAEISGTHVGNFLGLPPTGKAIRFRLVFLWDLEHGKILRDRRVYDFTGLLVQIGVLKAKPA